MGSGDASGAYYAAENSKSVGTGGAGHNSMGMRYVPMGMGPGASATDVELACMHCSATNYYGM